MKKWLKFLKDHKSFKLGQVEQVEDTAADIYVETGIAEATEEPKDAVAKAKAIADDIGKQVDERITAGIEQATKAIGDALEARLSGKAAGRATPRIVVGKDNELEDPTDGFKTFGQFTKAVASSCSGQGEDERLARRRKAAGGSENVNADGGYATPTEYAATVWNDVTDQVNLMPYCTLYPMNSNSIKLPAINFTTQGSFGVSANWEGEAVSIPTSKAAFRQPQLTLNKLTVLTPVTAELLEDGIAIESTISNLASQALTYKITDAILFGTGAGQPTGIVNHASTVSVTRDTTVTVKATDVIAMQSGLDPTARNPLWLINKGEVEPKLLTIADTAGRFLYFAPGSFPNDPNKGRLLGKPVIPLANCQAVGTAGDIILTDLRGYAIGYKASGIQKAMSIHLYFSTQEVAYRWTFRMDGRPLRDTTLSAARGSAKYGTSVTLSTK